MLYIRHAPIYTDCIRLPTANLRLKIDQLGLNTVEALTGSYLIMTVPWVFFKPSGMSIM